MRINEITEASVGDSYRKLLLEYKSEAAKTAILTKFGKKIEDKLKSDEKISQNARFKELTPSKLLDLLIDADPTKKSIYTDWLLKQYLSDQFRYLEDIFKATDLLAFYEKAKPKLPLEQRDIGRFQTFEQFYSFIENLQKSKIDTDSEREKERQFEKELIENKEVEIYYNSPDIKIVIPKTKRASCYFGRNTRWCTAAKTNNAFDAYNDSGPLYIIIFKKENKRWQFHFDTLQFMDERDEELKPTQVWSVGHLFKNTFLNPDNKKEQLATVRRYGFTIKYIKNPSEAIQLAAVERYGIAIKYIKNPSEKAQLAAVKQDGNAIHYIKNPSEKVQLVAVEQDGFAIKYIHIKNPSEAVQLAAVEQNGYAIKYIENPTEKVQLAAVKQYGKTIQYIKNPSEAIQLAAVKQDGYTIMYIENPTENVQLAAVKQDGNAIQYIKNPSEAVQLAAVERNGHAIVYIENPSEKVQLAAVEQNGNAIQYIKNPTEKVRQLFR